jgi:hypothetical protein
MSAASAEVERLRETYGELSQGNRTLKNIFKRIEIEQVFG